MAGETIYLKIGSTTKAETVRTGISKEKRRVEENLKAFEIPIENTRIKFEHQVNGTYKIYLKPMADFIILDQAPEEEEESDGKE